MLARSFGTRPRSYRPTTDKLGRLSSKLDRLSWYDPNSICEPDTASVLDLRSGAGRLEGRWLRTRRLLKENVGRGVGIGRVIGGESCRVWEGLG